MARNLEKKKLALEKRPFILEATKNDEAMMKSCQLPLYDQICPQPKTGTKRQHFDTTEESTQLPDGKRHAGLLPIPLMNDEGEVGVQEIVVTLATGLEVGPDGAVLNHQPILNPANLQSPATPNHNFLIAPETDRTTYHPVPTKYGPNVRRASLSNPNMDIREGDLQQQHQQQMQNLQDHHNQKERDLQVMIDRVMAQAKERDLKVVDMQEKLSKMVKVHHDQLEAQRKAVLLQREKERKEREEEKADREEEKKKRKVEVAAEKRELKKTGEVRAGEHDRMEQIMDNMQKELEDKQAGRVPEEDFHPEFTKDESVPEAGAPAATGSTPATGQGAPWQQATGKRRGSKSSPTQRKTLLQPHHQPQRDTQDEQRLLERRQKQQQLDKERQEKANQENARAEALERERIEAEEKDREEMEAHARFMSEVHSQF